jgi:transcriptional regulator with XRE-family HTH domain
MRTKNSTKKPTSVDKKSRCFHHDLDYAYMNINVDTHNQSQRLGRALRALRVARNWTLSDFERASGGRVKAVVIGSYERGSRSITVSKLQMIAAIYGVPMSAVLPIDSESSYAISESVIIDLRKLRSTLAINTSKNLLNLNVFITGLVNARRDYNGEILSLRASDLNFLAIMGSTNTKEMVTEFAHLQVLFTSKD